MARKIAGEGIPGRGLLAFLQGPGQQRALVCLKNSKAGSLVVQQQESHFLCKGWGFDPW